MWQTLTGQNEQECHTILLPYDKPFGDIKNIMFLDSMRYSELCMQSNDLLRQSRIGFPLAPMIDTSGLYSH